MSKGPIAASIAIVSAILAFEPTEGRASCSDRPGTPTGVRAEIIQGLTPMVKVSWMNTASEKVWWDVEITNGSGAAVDSPRPGVGRGETSKGIRSENTFGLPANGTRCFRVKARDQPGREGCVSAIWSNQACVTVGASGSLPYGPDTCKTGFVWREVVPSDHVCVNPTIRDRVRGENGMAAARRSPGGGSFGPDTCKQGFVWREAFPADHVCVDPGARDRTRGENAAAPANRVRG